MNLPDTLAANPIAQEWLISQAVLASMVAARLSGLIFAMPMLAVGLPMRMRLVLIVLLTIVLVPGLSQSATAITQTISIPDLVLCAGREAIFGMVIGGVVQLLVTGVQLAGELISNAAGMQMTQTADPSTGASVPQFSRLLGLLVAAILFAAGGHRMLIDGLLTSFRETPAMTVQIDESVLHLLINHLSVGVESGIRVAAPIVACLLLSNLVVAIISRSVPQFNVLAVGLNLNVMVALVMVTFTLGSVGLVFEKELSEAMTQVQTGWR